WHRAGGRRWSSVVYVMTTSTRADPYEARRKERLESRMMRKYPVRFGGGRMEKVRSDRNLASRLPYDLGALLHPHALGVQLDADHEAAVAQQRLGQLGQADLRVAVAVALFDRHLLAVVRPALDVAAAIGQLARLGRVLLGVEELDVVAGERLVDGDDLHH